MNKGILVGVYCLLWFIWSSTWLMIKVGLAEAPPVTSAAVRFIVAALIIFSILLIRRVPLPRSRRFIGVSLMLGIFQMGIPYALVYWGEQHISSGLAAILYSIMPLCVSVLAKLMLEDRLSRAKISGIIIGTAGVYVIFSDSVSLGGTMAAWGMLAMILSAIMASFSSVTIKKYMGPYDPFASLFIPILIGGVLMTCWGLAFERHVPIRIDGPFIVSVLYLAVLGTVTAFGLYYWIIKRIDVTVLSYMTFLIPILACLLGWIFLKETLTIHVLIGAVLIFTGIALATLRKPKERVHACNVPTIS
jgi:drug/metabolite transporter (DMT)-like permease